MRIYPKDCFEIDSPMLPCDILAALDAAVEPPKWFQWRSWRGRRFYGVVSIDGFKIERIIGYRNSFLPVIEGSITPSISGSCVAVTMRLDRLVATFMMFWLGGVSAGLMAGLNDMMKGGVESFSKLLIPAGMLVFTVAMTSGCFWWEAKKTKPILIDLLNGTERKPTLA